MRHLVTVSIPVDQGNKTIQDGTLPRTVMQALETLKPECAYFLTRGGVRTCLLVVDLADVSKIPVVAEPFFMNLGATVDFTPIMTASELAKGLAEAGARAPV